MRRILICTGVLLFVLPLNAQTKQLKPQKKIFALENAADRTGFDTGIDITQHGALFSRRNLPDRIFLRIGKPRPPAYTKDCNDRLAPELRNRFYCVEK